MEHDEFSASIRDFQLLKIFFFSERSAFAVTPILTPTGMWFGVGILGTLGNAVMT